MENVTLFSIVEKYYLYLLLLWAPELGKLKGKD